MATTRSIDYIASPTCAAFHLDLHPYRGIRGPVGSGKSVACCMDLFLKANEQVPVNGVRYSRFLIGRNTFSDLKNTTLATWMMWFPETVMHMSSPMTGVLDMPSIHNDGTSVHIELIFYALDAPRIMDSLMSLEICGAFVNEATQTSMRVVERIFSRCGRYRPFPNVNLKNFGVVMDTNSPDDSNWWYKLETKVCPKEMKFFVQPPGLLKRVDRESGRIWYEDNDGRDPNVPAAENIAHLDGGFYYYHKQTITGDHDMVKRIVLNEFGSTMEGRPVYPEYSDTLHYVDEEIPFMPGLPLFMGTDFGRTPAVVLGQFSLNGQLCVIDELCADNMSTEQFIEEVLRPRLISEYGFPTCRLLNFADPAGANPDQVVQMTCIQTYNKYGINTVAATIPQNKFDLRRDCVVDQLRTMIGGRPGIRISKKNQVLRKGFNGGYHYRKIGRVGDEAFSEFPDKNEYSHVHDAFQYFCWGLTRQGIDLSYFSSSVYRSPASIGGGLDLGGLC